MSTTLNGDRPNPVFGLGPSIHPNKSWHTPIPEAREPMKSGDPLQTLGDESNRAIGQLG
ncbi:hypothetical protein ACH47B_36710 [Rhodococcus sp. NPDC019627]|uniref:hypothetical protein n=1 Tax=unclassified Rhodococcus (in: high G+C Gram-positive bacteria) TaxID=192944 RepID=UPI0033EEA32F